MSRELELRRQVFLSGWVKGDVLEVGLVCLIGLACAYGSS